MGESWTAGPGLEHEHVVADVPLVHEHEGGRVAHGHVAVPEAEAEAG